MISAGEIFLARMPAAISAMLEKVDMVVRGIARVCASWMQVKREAMRERGGDKMS